MTLKYYTYLDHINKLKKFDKYDKWVSKGCYFGYILQPPRHSTTSIIF